jgi:hypothetical protein
MYRANGEIGAQVAALRLATTDGLMAIMTPQGRVASITAAAELMGLSVGTIRTYLNSKKTEYYRCA